MKGEIMNYIRTSGKAGNEIKKYIMDNSLGESLLVDRDYKKCDGVSVISLYKCVSQYKKGDSIIFPLEYIDKDEIEYLTDMGVLKENIKVFHNGSLIEWDTFTYLDYLEFHVNDHCNLNCKGCSHFCPLVREEIFADLEQVKKDFNRLKQLITHIKMIRIMGGEPLLCKNLDEYIETVRINYPLADIRIVTNATLIKNLPEKIWESFYSNKVKVDISFYPPLIRSADEILSIIEKHGIEIGNVGKVSSFEKILHNEQNVNFKNISTCICNNLHDGHIASCQLAFYGKYFNKYFNKNIPFETGMINIHDNALNGKTLVAMLDRPFEACKYCNQATFGINPTVIKWESCNSVDGCRESDWVTEGV